MSTLAETHDALLLDLDGTVYLGGQPIDHVGPALARASAAGRALGVRHQQRLPAAGRGRRVADRDGRAGVAT